MWWFMFFFFKQKTAYELRIRDWSSDVCSSDLQRRVESEPVIEWDDLVARDRQGRPGAPITRVGIGDDRVEAVVAAVQLDQHQHALRLASPGEAQRQRRERPGGSGGQQGAAGYPGHAFTLPDKRDRREGGEIGRAHVGTTVHHAHLVCRLLIEQ